MILLVQFVIPIALATIVDVVEFQVDWSSVGAGTPAGRPSHAGRSQPR